MKKHCWICKQPLEAGTVRKACKPCQSAYNRRYRAAHQEHCRALDRANYARNSEQIKAKTKRWYHQNRERSQESKRLSMYGLVPGEFEAMLELQAGLCAICTKPMTPGKDTHIDHCHQTGVVRGLLCRECNMGIGKFEDSISTMESAIAYLTEYRKVKRQLPMAS